MQDVIKKKAKARIVAQISNSPWSRHRTKASVILQFFQGLRGDMQVTFEEGTALLGCTTCSSPMWREW